MSPLFRSLRNLVENEGESQPFYKERAAEKVPQAFKDVRKQSTTLFTRNNNASTGDDSLDGHGTCIASKVVGHYYGVSKATRLVVFKMRYDVAGLTSAFIEIDKYLREKRSPQEPAVLLVPFTSIHFFAPTTPTRLGQPWTTIREKLQKYQNKYGVMIVLSAGDRAIGSQKLVMSMPAALAYDDSQRNL